MEAVIPAEIGMPTLRTAEIDMVQNDEALGINLDLLEERREQVAIREARSKAKMEKYCNSKVRNTSFKPGDLVYRNNDASHAKDSGKLSPKWEGPYEEKGASVCGMGGTEPASTKVVDKAVVVATTAGTPDVLVLPTRFSADSGSSIGTKAS
ncbi:hypothetical protein Tco_0006973 [Tanacetum coccineum]